MGPSSFSLSPTRGSPSAKVLSHLNPDDQSVPPCLQQHSCCTCQASFSAPLPLLSAHVFLRLTTNPTFMCITVSVVEWQLWKLSAVLLCLQQHCPLWFVQLLASIVYCLFVLVCLLRHNCEKPHSRGRGFYNLTRPNRNQRGIIVCGVSTCKTKASTSDCRQIFIPASWKRGRVFCSELSYTSEWGLSLENSSGTAKCWLEPKQEKPLGQINIQDKADVSEQQTNKQIKNITIWLSGREKAIDYHLARRDSFKLCLPLIGTDAGVRRDNLRLSSCLLQLSPHLASSGSAILLTSADALNLS